MTKPLLLILSVLYARMAFSQQWFSSPAPNGRDINCLKIFNRDTIIVAGGWHIVSPFQTEISPAAFKTSISGLGLWNVLNIVDSNKNWIRSIDFSGNNTGIAVGWGGRIYSTTNGGENWGVMPSPIERDFNRIFFINNQQMIIVGGEHADSVAGGIQTILKTTNGGQTWNVAIDQPGYWLQSVYFINATTGYAVGDSGTILKSINGGNTWNAVASPIQRNFNAIWFTDVNNGVIVGGNFSRDSMRTVLKTVNGGNTWTIVKDELGGMLRDVHFADASTGYAVGDRATVLKTTDGGMNWNAQVIPGTAGDEQFNAVRFHDPDFGFVAGKWGAQYIYNTAQAPAAQTTAAEVIDTSVILNGLVNSHGENSVYSFLFSPDNFSASIFETGYPGYVLSTSFAPAPYSLQLRYLTPNTTYEYLLKAWTLGGTVYGDTLSFSLGNSNAELNTLSATNITETSATLHGSIKGYNVMNLYFEYGATPQFGSQIAATPSSVNDSALQTVSATISSLQSNVVYYYRLKGVLGTTRYYGNTLSLHAGDLFTVLETLPPANVLDSSATLNGQVQGFKLSANLSFEYSANSMTFDSTAISAMPQLNDTMFHFLSSGISGLTPATLYYYRLKAETAVGTFYGDTVSFYSGLSGDNFINTLPATDVTLTSAVLRAEIGRFGVPIDLSFEYGVTTALGNEITGTPASINDTAAQAVAATVSGLQTNTVYFYRLKAEVASGIEFYGNIRQFYTGNSEIPNWDFQYWQRDTLQFANGWNVLGDSFERVPGHSGNYALKLSGPALALLGIFYDSGKNNSNDELRLVRGVPFRARPDSLSVYLNYFVSPGDTGIILIHMYDTSFNDICTVLYQITGNSSGTFKRVAVPITYNSSLMPDTLVVGFVPTSPDVPNNNNYFIIDDIAGVPASPVIYNGDFEDWFDYSANFLLGWYYFKDILIEPTNATQNPMVVQTLFSPPADYAAQITNFSFGGGLWGGADISNKNGFADKAHGGFPVNARHQSFNGYFKWFPVVGDTMFIDVQLFLHGQVIGSGNLINAPAVTEFTRFDIPITYTAANLVPDTATIRIKSYFNGHPYGASRLIVDKLSFDGFVGVEEMNAPVHNNAPGITVFPNPATSVITVQLEKEMQGVLQIFNLHGKQMYKDDFAGKKVEVNAGDFPKGLYIVKISQGTKKLSNKFIVIR